MSRAASEWIALIQTSPIAIRGERLALQRLFASAQDPTSYEVELLLLTELDTEGRIVGVVHFDPENVDAAFEELDERFLASDEATELSRAGHDLLTAYNTREWERFGALFTDDCVVVDHRPVSGGVMQGAEARILNSQELIALVPNLRMMILAVDRESASLMLARTRSAGTDELGNPVEFVNSVIMRSSGSQISLLEYFAPEAINEAMARYEELESEASSAALDTSAHAHLENVCMVAARRLDEAALRGDWPAVAAQLAEDITLEDRRQGLRWSLVGRDALLEQMRIIAAGSQIHHEPLAVRGDRLALWRHTVLAGGFEVESLVVLELNEAGQHWRGINFEPDDLDGAFRVLDERYLNGEGAPYAQVWLPICELRLGYNTRDWLRTRALLADDATLADHRPVSLGVLTADEWVRSMSVQVDLSPDMRFFYPTILYIDSRVVVSELHAIGSTSEGGEVELRFINVDLVRGGLIRRHEWFPIDALDTALARARELSEASD
jgi:hypothetical protein